MERLKDLPAGVDGVRVTGRVDKDDYESVFASLLDEARRDGRRLRLLYQLAPGFETFTARAAWQDTRLALPLLRLLDRCAIVGDVGWIQKAAGLFGAMVPCAVRVYPNDQLDEAVAWLATPVDTRAVTHRLLPDTGVLVIEPAGPLRKEDFEAISLTVDPWIESRGSLRGIVVHARAFPGWESLGAFFRHLRFVRDHHRSVGRVALAVDGKLASLAPKIAEHFVAADLKQFGYDRLDDALAWAGAAPAPAPGPAVTTRRRPPSDPKAGGVSR